MKRILKKITIFAKLLNESVIMAISQLKGDWLRTFLSLLGVSIGIFSIVTVFSAIDGLNKNVSEGLESISSETIFISKWPGAEEVVENSGVFRWWDYINRPNTTYDEYEYIKANSELSEAIAYVSQFRTTVKYKRESVSGALILGTNTKEIEAINKSEVDRGRYISLEEDRFGTAVGVIGAELAKELFKEVDPIGKKIKIRGYTVTIVGVLKKLGESMVNVNDTDNSIVIPINFTRNFLSIRSANNQIMALPKAGVGNDEFKNEIKLLLRAHRRLTPVEKDDFSISSMSFILKQIDGIFVTINSVGWLIAGFSLLIGGFGIANIMFVSVKERTNIIGIQKALGAKKYMILTQFLTEAVVLSIMGSIVGIAIAALLINLVSSSASTFQLTLTAGNILSGVLIASVIGLISGITPAWSAANLNPVEAISAN